MKKAGANSTIILIVAWLAYTSVYIGRLNLSVASPMMEMASVINKDQIGYLSSLFFFVYAIGRIFNGYIGDKVEPKFILGIGLMLSALSNIGMGFMLPVSFMFVIWGLNGYAQSTMWGPAMRVVTEAYEDPKKRTRAAMILSTSIGAGGIIGIAAATAVSGFGAAAVFFVPGCIMLVISAMVLLVLPRTKRSAGVQRLSPFKLALNKDILKIIFPALAHGAIKDNLNLWMVTYFVESYNTDVSASAPFVFMIPTATLIGRMVYPLLYRLCKYSDKWSVVISFVICAASLVPIIFFKLPMALCCLLLCFTALSVSMINVAFLAIYPLRFQATNNGSMASGLIDFVTYMGSAIGSFVFGIVISAFGFNIMYIIWIVISAVSALIMLFNKKPRPLVVD